MHRGDRRMAKGSRTREHQAKATLAQGWHNFYKEIWPAGSGGIELSRKR